MNWQTIESVPDGVEIIIKCEYGVCTAVRELGQYWYLQTGGHRPTSLYDDPYVIQWPTHWMPLPEPPAIAIEAATAGETVKQGSTRSAKARAIRHRPNTVKTVQR